MMKRKCVIPCLALVIACGLANASTEASDLSGVWSSDVSQCGKIFVKGKSEILFAGDSDLYGGGLIIDQSKIRTKTAICRIKSKSEVGDATNLLVTCKTQIMVSDMQLSFKVLAHNSISRIYPGIMELDSRYARCEM